MMIVTMDHHQQQHGTQRTAEEEGPQHPPQDVYPTKTTTKQHTPEVREEPEDEHYAAGPPRNVAVVSVGGTALVTDSTTTTEEEDSQSKDCHDQHQYYHQHTHVHGNRRSSSSSTLFLHTIPEDCEWFEDDVSSTSSCSSTQSPPLPDGLAWVGILRNTTLLMDIGQDHVPESVPATAGALLVLERNHLSGTTSTLVGWDRVVVPPMDGYQDDNNDNAAIVGLRFHVYDPTHEEEYHDEKDEEDASTTNENDDDPPPPCTVWSFACVYNAHNLTERQAQWFVQEHMVRATQTVRAVDPAWRHGDYHAVQALWAPLLQAKIQEYEATTIYDDQRHINNNNNQYHYTRSKLHRNNNSNGKQGASGGGEPNLDFCRRIIQENRRLVLQEQSSRHGDEWDESDMDEEEDNGSDDDDDEYDTWTPAQPLEDEDDNTTRYGSDWLVNFLAPAASSSPHNNNNCSGKGDTEPILLSSNHPHQTHATMVQQNINHNNTEMGEVKVRAVTVDASDDKTEDLTTTTMHDDNTNHLEEEDEVAVMDHLGTLPVLEPTPEKGAPASSPTSVLVARLAPEAPPGTTAKSTTKKARAVTDEDDNDHRHCFFCFSFWAPKQPAFIDYNRSSREEE